MLRNLADAWGWLQRIIRRLDRIESGAILENASITSGRLRLIGALLRIDSGGRLEVVGTWRLIGTGAITGDVYSEGKWTQVGDYDFTGDGALAGDVTMSGNFDLTGKFTSQNVRIEGGKIYVGAGASQIVIDGATGRITAGNLTIDPASNGGSIKFATGPEVYAAATTMSLYSGALNGGYIDLGPGLAKINGGGTRWIEVTSTGFKLVGLPTIARASANNAVVGTLWSDTNGNLFRVV